jgi:hypothetical protein
LTEKLTRTDRKIENRVEDLQLNANRIATNSQTMDRKTDMEIQQRDIHTFEKRHMDRRKKVKAFVTLP